MDHDTAAAFQRLKEADPSNRRCLECDTPEPQWCALSYGAFVCLNCSSIHRSLGVHLSFVRSSTMDAWQPLQVKMMEVGGNAKCKNFFVEYGVWDMPPKERYATKAAAYYRALLRSAAEPSITAPPLPLKREEAAEPEVTISSSPSYSSIRSLGSNLLNEQQAQREEGQQGGDSAQEEGFMATLQQQAVAASAAAAAAAATVSNTGGAAIDSALQSVTSFVSGAREYTAKTFEAAGESNFVEKAKGGLQSGSEWIAQQGKRISSTFSEFFLDFRPTEARLSSFFCRSALAALASSLPIDCSIDEHCDAAGSDASADGGCTSSSPRLSEEQPQEGEEGLQSQQRSGSGVLDSMRDFTRRSLSNVSQVVRSSNSGVGEGGGVLEKAREGLSSLTAVATGWLQPAETPSPESSKTDTR
ncbi:LOW QUALITY PROTEIN: ADP-ribosylation factor GTPase-activating protein AGD7 [Cyclospora cayetanensis]|uniref:LOW QUALITY PROTEIN: ADP-ribosylation factor GTPase-activating protein AGD7 n=1 Tax=Cyclospora cayetanensis TaxID=88456 RepID=A0A6P6RQZ2_9EIME|nr:LOW QUALITY PROTEIN: ADP-ribosylation factor GTPase-activating protein AGD7 [Cyclospora cayetanensis]